MEKASALFLPLFKTTAQAVVLSRSPLILLEVLNLSPLILLEYYCTAALQTVGSGAFVSVESGVSHCGEVCTLNCSYYRALSNCPW